MPGSSKGGGENMEPKLEALPYARARREYFEAQIAKQERRLKWWESQKAWERYSGFRIFDECSECGAIINYYEDAIRALDGDEAMKERGEKHELE